MAAKPKPKPKSKSKSELEVIAELARIFGGTRSAAGLELGIGDDAALIRARGRLAWTIDTSVEGVHFERGWLTLEQVGYRSLQAAASDICAMGGRPRFVLSSLIVPPWLDGSGLARLARGQRRAADELGCRVVGGNLARGDALSVTSSVLGETGALTRAGARAGDELWLLGDVGLAALGLELLRRGKRRGANEHERAALAAFREPRAQLRAGVALAKRARSAIDVSDGLAGDAAHVARASGVRVLIELAALARALSPSLCVLAPRLGLEPLTLALYGGEDYALLATGPARARPRGARVIGRVSRGSDVWLEKDNAQLSRAGRGFQHF